MPVQRILSHSDEFTWKYPFSVGFPGGSVGKIPTSQSRRCGFHLWVRKFPWRRRWQLPLVVLPGEFRGRGSWWTAVHGVTKASHDFSGWTQQSTLCGTVDTRKRNTKFSEELNDLPGANFQVNFAFICQSSNWSLFSPSCLFTHSFEPRED